MQKGLPAGPDGLSCTSPKENCTQKKGWTGDRSWQGCSEAVQRSVPLVRASGDCGGVEQAKMLSLVDVEEVFHWNSRIGSRAVARTDAGFKEDGFSASL